MVGAIAIGSVICIIAAIAGDTSQDLKTGFLLGATPKKQQYGELIGVCVSARRHRCDSLPAQRRVGLRHR